MFIRVKSTPNSPRKSVQIVESYRKGDKVKQKILRHVGIAMDDSEEIKLCDLATEVMAKLIHEQNEQSPQQGFFSIDATEIRDYVQHTQQKKRGRP